MTRTAIYTPSIWGAAASIVFTAVMGLADALLVAWWIGSAWGQGVAAGAIVGLMLSVAWALRRYLPAVSLGLLVTSAAMTILLARQFARRRIVQRVRGAWHLGHLGSRLRRVVHRTRQQGIR